MSELIRLREISRIYKNGKNEFEALKGVDLSVKSGEYLSVLGSSGSGKSTLMNIIGCLDRADGGEYFLNGKDTARFSERELELLRCNTIGFVFQRFCLFPSLSAYENVELPLIYAKIPANLRKERVLTALNTVGLIDKSKNKPCQLSGGQQQRVALARAIVKNPPLILADEPTGNLDPDMSDEISQVFEQLHKSGKTIILITHDKSVAEKAQRRVIIENGRLENCV